ncbi:GDSL-type esterase/lipase family protein [Novosphingobium sp. B 225]|uniref:GDSL-type esterase/lipase family protein n=1 Tax=Novosphingobium sp. B 225 TaxID=1961849 RepID=UPI000B4AAB34|nr:GDSL-type esterase/lipase family protein [Novosphingobium sp. B 225]
MPVRPRTSALLLTLPALLLSAPAWGQTTTAKPESYMLDEACTPQSAGAYNPQADWAWLCRYHAANLALPGQHADIVFIGDSITEGWSRFTPGLFTGGIVNRGISGQTSPQLLLRFMADVIALKPRVVHLMIGTNDIAGNTGPTTPVAYQNNVRAMVTLAKAAGIRVILGSIPPADRMSWRPEVKPAPRIAELNRWLKDYAKEQQLTFADYHAILSGPNGELRTEFGRDGVHPEAAGYAVMEPVTRAALAAALSRAVP